MTTSMLRTRAEALAASIEEDLESSEHQPGDLYGTLDSIRAGSGFARSTVSEAVRLLSDRGVLDVRPGRGGGLFVAAANPVVRLRHMLLSVRGDSTPIEHAIAVRDALEGLIALEAAQHRTPVQVERLRGSLGALHAAASDLDAWRRANWELHEQIASITPNHLLSATYVGMLRHIADAAIVAVVDTPEQHALLRRRTAIHVELVEAIISGDEARTEIAARRHNQLT